MRVCDKLEGLRVGIDEQMVNSMVWFVVQARLDKDTVLRIEISQKNVDV